MQFSASHKAGVGAGAGVPRPGFASPREKGTNTSPATFEMRMLRTRFTADTIPYNHVRELGATTPKLSLVFTPQVDPESTKEALIQ